MAALLAPISLANLIFTLGVPESVAYYVSKNRLTPSRGMKIATAAALICGAAGAATLWLATPLLFGGYPQYRGAYSLLLATLPITLGFAVVRGILQGLRKFDSVNRERIGGVVLRLVALSTFAIFGLLNPVDAVWITVISAAIGSLFLLAGLRGEASREWIAPVPVHRVMRFAGSASLGTLGGFLVLRLDQAVMVPLSGPIQLGYYAVAVSLAELPLTIVMGVRDIVFTVASATNDPRLAAQASRVTTVAMIPICGFGCLLAPVAIPLMFGAQFRPAIPMTQLLFLGTVASTGTGILSAGLMSVGRAGMRSAIQIGGAVLTTLLLVLLVPRYGGIGASLASVSTYVALSLSTACVFSRVTHISLRDTLVPSRADVVQVVRRFRK